MNYVEMRAELEAVKRIDIEGEKRHYYLDCRYEGELLYEFEGKKYRVLVQIDDPDLRKDRIRLDIYPTVLARYGRDRMPAYMFEGVECAKNVTRDMTLFTCPTAITERKDYAGNLNLILTVDFKTVYTFTYKAETVTVEHSEKIQFLVREV